MKSNRITVEFFESRRQLDKRSKVECHVTLSTDDEYDLPGSEIQFRIQAAATACKEIIQQSGQEACTAPPSSDSEENLPEDFNDHRGATDVPNESRNGNHIADNHSESLDQLSPLQSAEAGKYTSPESELRERKSLATTSQLRAIDRLAARRKCDSGELCQQLFGFPETTDLFQEQASQLIRELQKHNRAA